MTRVDSLLLEAMLHVHLYDLYHLLQFLLILPQASKVAVVLLCFLLMCCFPSVYSVRFIAASSVLIQEIYLYVASSWC